MLLLVLCFLINEFNGAFDNDILITLLVFFFKNV